MIKIIAIFLSLCFLSSCYSVQYRDGGREELVGIEAGKSCLVKTDDGMRLRNFKIDSIGAEHLYGTQCGKPLTIEKNRVTEMRKYNAAQTVLLAAGVVGFVAIGTAVFNDVEQEIYEGILDKGVN